MIKACIVGSKSLVVFLDVDDPFDIYTKNNDLFRQYAALQENQINWMLHDQTKNKSQFFKSFPCSLYVNHTVCLLVVWNLLVLSSSLALLG